MFFVDVYADRCELSSLEARKQTISWDCFHMRKSGAPTQIEKLEAHTKHLLDVFLSLKERYSILHPMLFDPKVVRNRGSGKQARGFLMLRQSLFLSCSQDIAKLTLDNDRRTPSIHNLVSALKDGSVISSLRSSFVEDVQALNADQADPGFVESLRKIEGRRRLQAGEDFDRALRELHEHWNHFHGQAYLSGFSTIRDKVTAHTEIRHEDGHYKSIDIGDLDIKWSDLELAITNMQGLIDKLSLLIRNAGFAWDSLDHRLRMSSSDFWTDS